MRLVTAALLVLTCVIAGAAQQPDRAVPGRRYGVELDTAKHPQATPQEALASVLKTIETARLHYLLAQLADPEFVDRRVQEYKSTFPRGSDEAKAILAFDRLLSEVKAHFREDPTLVKELYRLSREGEWQGGDDVASVRLKTSPERGAFFRKFQDRWFLLNRQNEPAPEKKGS